MKRYYIITYGCQMNIADSNRIASILESAGYSPAPLVSEADLVAVNMCSVRQSAVDRVFGLAKKMQGKQSIITGCILKKDKKKFQNIFDYVININEISKIPEILKNHLSQNSYDRRNFTTNKKDYSSGYLKIKPGFLNLIAHIPITTGCDNFCSYCVVPYARGKETSRKTDEIIKETKLAVKNGAKEIWLLGQNVNSYNYKLQIQNLPVRQAGHKSQIPARNAYGIAVAGGNPKSKIQNLKTINFPKLLKIINNIKGDFWIKFTSSHPKDFSEKLIKTMKSCKKAAKYLNLPVQSGDDNILKKMNRPYTAKQYKELVKKIRKEIPDISLSTDVIVGFPSETKKQFNNTVKLFKEIKFDMAYINKYSPRHGTVAFKLKDNVPIKEKQDRERILNKVLKKTALEKNEKYVGKIIKVLIESKNKGFLLGKTEGNKTVKISQISNLKYQNENSKCKVDDLIGKFINIKITNAMPWGLEG